MEKIKNGVTELTCTQKALAEALQLTPMRVNQLIAEKIVVADESDKGGGVYLFESVKNFYLSRNVQGTGVDYWKERGLNERAKRQLNELKVQQTAGEMYLASDVENGILELVTALRNNLLGLPATLAAQLENLSREEIYAELTSEIENLLEELSNYGNEKQKRTVENSV